MGCYHMRRCECPSDRENRSGASCHPPILASPVFAILLRFRVLQNLFCCRRVQSASWELLLGERLATWCMKSAIVCGTQTLAPTECVSHYFLCAMHTYFVLALC